MYTYHVTLDITYQTRTSERTMDTACCLSCYYGTTVRIYMYFTLFLFFTEPKLNRLEPSNVMNKDLAVQGYTTSIAHSTL